MKLIEVTLEEYDNFKSWYFNYAKRTQNIRKLKIKTSVEMIKVIDRTTNEQVCHESHSLGNSKYRIIPKWYEIYKTDRRS